MAFLTDYTQGQWASEVSTLGWQLSARVRNVSTGKVVNRYTGEMAWSDAQRQVNDLAMKDVFS